MKSNILVAVSFALGLLLGLIAERLYMKDKAVKSLDTFNSLVFDAFEEAVEEAGAEGEWDAFKKGERVDEELD